MRKHRLIGLVLIVALLVYGMALAAPVDHVYIGNERVDKLNLDGSLDMNFLGPSSENCRQLAVDGISGNVWLGCQSSDTITLFSSNGNVIYECNNPTWPVPFTPAPNQFCATVDGGMCIDPYSNLWVTSRVEDWVWKFQPDGTRLGPFFTGGSGPSRIACDQFGNVWTSSNSSDNVSKLANDGTLLTTVPTPNAPSGVAIDMDGNVWVPTNAGYIVKISNDTSSVQNLGGGSIFGIGGVAVDQLGNVWISQPSNDNIIKLSSNGDIIATYVPGNNTEDLAIDASGNVWVVDRTASTITKLANDGTNLGTFPLSGNSGQADTGFLHQRFVLGYNTVEGPNVWVPLNGGAPAGAVTLNYDTITAMGDTDYVESGAGLAPPADYKLGDLPEYYDITTTAVFSGNVEVCLGYDESEYDDEATLKLFHNEAGWVDVTTSLDITNNVLCGIVTSLSGEFVGVELAGPYCGPGLFCYGDQDGDGIATLVDYNAARDEALIMPVDYSQVYPSNSETLDVDASFSVDLVDVNIMRDWALLKTNALADPGIPATVTILSPPDLSVVAIGETVELVVEVRGSGSALRPGVGVVFELLSGSATFLGGRGNSASWIDPDTGSNYTAGSRWSVTGDIAGGAIAKMVLKRDAAGMIQLQARVPQSPLKQLPASIISATLTLN